MAIDIIIIFILLLTLFLLSYGPFITVLRLRKLKRDQIRKRIFKFITLFLLLSILNFGFDFVFRRSDIDLSRNFSFAMGAAFGTSFFDLIFYRKKKK